jgi:hypothetical protein
MDTAEYLIKFRNYTGALSNSIFAVSNFVFSAFYLVNVMEANKILKQQKPWSQRTTSVLVGGFGLAIFVVQFENR